MTRARTTGIRFCWKKSFQSAESPAIMHPLSVERVRMVAATSSASFSAAVFVQNLCPRGLVI
jgi:hypothetical protein